MPKTRKKTKKRTTKKTTKRPAKTKAIAAARRDYNKAKAGWKAAGRKLGKLTGASR